MHAQQDLLTALLASTEAAEHVNVQKRPTCVAQCERERRDERGQKNNALRSTLFPLA